jgi:TRAP-type uncharacterized transport system substrate-binding protein
MERRTCIQLALLGVAGLLMGHAPYRQWHVYRGKRLFILASAAEEDSFALGQAVAQVLATHLPESRAMAARARDTLEIVKLLVSQQLDVALLPAETALAALHGRGRFQEEGALLLRTLAVFGPYLLVCRDDFAAARAYQIARTLAEHGGGLPHTHQEPPPGAAESSPLPWHSGAQAFYAGAPLPPEEEHIEPP